MFQEAHLPNNITKQTLKPFSLNSEGQLLTYEDLPALHYTQLLLIIE